MANRLPTLRQLHYLVELSETLHFGQAAERSFVSQSSFSTGILELEKQLGGTLFERNNRHVALTAFGEQALERAKRILLEANDLVEFSRTQQLPFSESLQLAIIPSILPFILTSLSNGFSQHYPLSKLHVHELQTHQALTALANGTVDMVLMALPYAVSEFKVHTLFSEPLYWVGHKDLQPTLTQPSQSQLPQSFSTLNLSQLILLEEGHCLRDHTLSACSNTKQMHALSEHNRLQASSLMTLYALIKNKFGFTFLPKMATDSGWFMLDPNLHYQALQDAPTRDIALVTRKTSSKLAEFDAIAELLSIHI